MFAAAVGLDGLLIDQARLPVYAMPPEWIPDKIVLDGYINPCQLHNAGRSTATRIFLVGMNTVLTLISSSIVAFAFARMRFRGRDPVLRGCSAR